MHSTSGIDVRATLLRELGRVTREPVALLVRGPAGSGKSEILDAAREHLRRLGISPKPIVIDDIHALSEERLRALAGLVEDQRSTFVLACEPRPHQPLLRAVADGIALRGKIFDIRPLTLEDIAEQAAALDVSLTRDECGAISAATGGARTAVKAVLTTLSVAAPDPIVAIDAAVTSWATTVLTSLDTELLATLALTASGAGLDVDEVAELVCSETTPEPAGVGHSTRAATATREVALRADRNVAAQLVDRARACALVTTPCAALGADVLLPAAVEPLRAVLGDRRFTELQHRLFTLRLDAGILRPAVAVRLAGLGVRDQQLAGFLCTAAESAEPAEAAERYAAAVEAGADPDTIAVARMEATAASEDFATAMVLAESILDHPKATDRDLAAAVRIATTIWAHRGVLRRGADLYTWLRPDRVGTDAGLATAVLLGVGDVQGADAMREARPTGAPTDAVATAEILGLALHQSLTGPGATAINTLFPALSIPARKPTPVSPVAVASLLCLHSGDLPRAEAIVHRALDDSTAPVGSATRTYYQLLAAWTAMLAGEEGTARVFLEAAENPPHRNPHHAGSVGQATGQRNRVLAQALRVGLARRAGDHGALVAAWADSHRVLDDISVDLFCLLPLGELWLAATRLGDTDRIDHLIGEARGMLARLGNPPAWAGTFHWYGVQAAILGSTPQALVAPANALGAAAEAGDSYARVLAAAGRTWLRVLRDEVNPDAVETAARTLAGVGLGWDAARLASEAALRADDTVTATRLLQVARSLRTRPSTPARGASPMLSATPTLDATSATKQSTSSVKVNSALSDREIEVANLVVMGHTYREIGSQLYISAKTVEHHVARIRRRLGAGSRSELLSMLRAMGHG